MLETFIEYIMYFIPFYYVLKLAFIISLMVRMPAPAHLPPTPLKRPPAPRCPATTPRRCT